MTRVALSDLNELPKNPRKISKRNFERLKKSIVENTKAIPEKERGDGLRLVENITVNRQGNWIVCGHMRVRALKELNQDWIDNSDITWIDVEPGGEYENALNITDNSDDFSGSWDQRKLQLVMSSIRQDEELFKSLDFPEIKSENIVDRIAADKTEATQENEAAEDKPPENTPDEGPDEDDEERGERLYPLSYAVTKEQKMHILEAIKMAKDGRNLETSAEALALVCDDYLSF